jgi:hypothetical protein
MKLLFSLLILLCAFTTHAQFMSAHRLATLQAQAIVGINADTFMDFHAQTIGAAYNTNLVQSDVWGNPTGWAVTLATAPHTYTNVIVPNFNFSTPIQTPDGHIASGTGTNGLLQDLSEGATGIMQQDFTGFSAHVSSVTFWLMFTNISAPNTSSYDLYNLFENPYSIAEFKSDNSDYGPYGSQIRTYIHTEIAPASYTAGLGTNLWMKGELLQDYYSGLSYLSLFNATNSALLYSSVAYGTPSVTDVQDLLRVTAGYIHVAPDSGYIYRTPFYLQLDSHVPTNRPPWVPNAPSGISAGQTGAGTMLVSMTDNNSMLNSNLLHYSNSIDGDAVQWIQPQQTSCTVAGLTVHTYDTRIESYFVNGIKSAAIAGPSVTITNIPNPEFITGTGSTYFFNYLSGYIGYYITVGASDVVVTDLGMFAHNTGVTGWSGYSSMPVSIRKYSDCSVVASATIDISAHDDAYHYSSITPVTLTAGTTYSVVFYNPAGDAWAKDCSITHDSSSSVNNDISNGSCSNTAIGVGADSGCMEPTFRFHL